MLKRQFGLIIATATAVALTLAGCSASASTDSGAGDDTVTIGFIGSMGSPQGASLTSGPVVIQKWVDDINGAGGLAGHQVKLVVKDDAGNATTAATVAKQLVQEDKVVAIVGPLSFADAAWGPIVEAAGIPVLGGAPSFGLEPATSPDFFPIGANAVSQNYGIVSVADTLGGKLATVYCAEVPGCAVAGTLQQSAAEDVGVDSVVSTSASASQPSYAAQCQAIKDSGATAVNIALQSDIALRMWQECIDSGVDATLIPSGGEATPAWLEEPVIDGSVNVDLQAPFFTDATPGGATYREFVSTLDLGAGDGEQALWTYSGAELLKAAVEASGDDAITADSIKAGLYSLKDETLGGLTAPLNFVKGEPTVVSCWFTSQISDGEWELTDNGTEPVCAPQDTITSLLTDLLGG